MTIEKEAKATLLQALQGEDSSATAFQNFMRAEIRSTLWELMKEEVESLCGTSHRPLVDARYRRAGSDDGIMYFDGRKERIKRPRVRALQSDGSEREVVLKTYWQARSSG
jgi:hypothetical protein